MPEVFKNYDPGVEPENLEVFVQELRGLIDEFDIMQDVVENKYFDKADISERRSHELNKQTVKDFEERFKMLRDIYTIID
jgi:hypothetical protein